MSHRYFAVAAWLTFALISFATLSPIGLRPEFSNQALEHLAAVIVLAFLFGLAYPTATPGFSMRQPSSLAA